MLDAKKVISSHMENPSMMEANPNAIKQIPAIQDTASVLYKG